GDFAVGASHSVGEGIATVLVGLLLDPEFLYFVEAAGDEVAPGIVELTDHELAARLARVLWDAVPDAELSAAADAGLDDATLAAQIDRMLADPRATSAIMRFAGDWLRLETLPYPSEELLPDPAAREALHADMQAELLRFFAATTLETEGTYADLLLDRTAWVQTDELATIYGVAPGDEVTLTEQRAGLLTRAGWLASIDIRGSDAGHLIKRGNKLGRFICRELPPPDPANFPTDDPADPSTNPDAGIRERFQEATASATCSGCHVQLDAFGAPFGHYGAAGQWIDEETIVAEDGSSHRLVIDTTSTIDLDGAIAIDDAIALSEALASSDVAAHCLADQLARNALARPLQDGDGCLSQAARDALAPAEGTPQSLREAIVQLLLAPHFRQVRVP
ncbi:MAG TPA: DUF1592 domain-containing protein, partial [Nannocystaceae bacterium]|nr:DUF1592 domain-containing protein [Nannocystaceae bacterium]